MIEENKHNAILNTEKELLEESTKQAQYYNECNKGGKYIAIGTNKSQIEYIVPNESGIKLKTEDQLKRMGLYNYTTINEFITTQPFQNDIKKRASTYLINKKYQNGTWFFLSGQSMIGKKHIVSAITKEILNKGYHVSVLNYLNMQDIKDKYMNKSTSIINTYKHAEILIILNLWHNSINSKDIELIERIVEYRSNNQKTTIITCDQTSTYNLKKISVDVYKNIKLNAREYFILVPYSQNNEYKI
jgi:DNA replication protein DnaC